MNKFRGQFYPFHHHYYEMRLVFRPYVMFIQEPGFDRDCVSTDSFGMRHQHIKGRDVGLAELRKAVEMCDVMVGGSTVFGVDASSNATTIAAVMSKNAKDGVPVINLGIRGAMPQQELIAFLMLRDMLPKVRRIHIVSGVNVASFAAHNNALINEDYGCLFSEEYNYNLMRAQYQLFTASQSDVRRYRSFDWFEALYNRNSFVRNVVHKIAKIDDTRPKLPGRNRNGQLELLLKWFERDLKSWKDVENSVESIEFCLQPAVNWCSKSLSEREKLIMDVDRSVDPTLTHYSTRDYYLDYRSKISRLCDEAGIKFRDVNEWFDDPAHAGRDYFTDVCHLNDNGNAEVAKFMAS